MTEQERDYDGWEKEEATDFDDYLQDLGPARVEAPVRTGRGERATAGSQL